MPERQVWYVGNRDPSISDIIKIDGVVVNLTGKTVRFKARVIGESSLIVDQPISNTPDTTGFVRYDWQVADANAGGILADPHEVLVWWEVTSAGKKQDVGEAIIEIRAHGPAFAYVELETMKSTLKLAGTTFADGDLLRSLPAASRAIEKICHRRFYLDTDANQTRYYTPRRSDYLNIDDLVELTSLNIDRDGDGTFEETWTENIDFVLEPLNAPSDFRPYEAIRRHDLGIGWFTCVQRSVEVTGQFGWAEVPEEVETAVSILTTRLVKRTREAPFGVVGAGLEQQAVRLARNDPDFEVLLARVIRTEALA